MLSWVEQEKSWPGFVWHRNFVCRESSNTDMSIVKYYKLIKLWSACYIVCWEILKDSNKTILENYIEAAPRKKTRIELIAWSDVSE